MPELPEVETVRRGLESLVLGQEIVAVKVEVPKMVKSDLRIFLQTLPGKTIQTIGRRGKYLVFDFGQTVLVSHLRMEGKYLLFPDEVPEQKHFHVFFTLKNGSTLVYQDVRKFGTFDLIPKSQLSDFLPNENLVQNQRKRPLNLNRLKLLCNLQKTNQALSFGSDACCWFRKYLC